MTSRTKLWIGAFVYCFYSGYPAALLAQQPRFAVGTTLIASFNSTGQFTDGYRLKLDGVNVGPDILVTTLGAAPHSVQRTIGSPSVGDHALMACAFNVDREVCTAPLSFNIYQPQNPSLPTNLTITVQVAMDQDGTVSVVGVTAKREQP